MSNNFLKFIVIFLALLIFICFVFLLYGLYSKISNNQILSNNEIINYSLNLKESENIKDIKIIDENNALVVISNDDQSYLIMYNLKENKIRMIVDKKSLLLADENLDLTNEIIKRLNKKLKSIKLN